MITYRSPTQIQDPRSPAHPWTITEPRTKNEEPPVHRWTGGPCVRFDSLTSTRLSPAATATGSGMGRDRLHHWRIAYASAKELDCHLTLLAHAGAISRSGARDAMNAFDQVRAMTWRLLTQSADWGSSHQPFWMLSLKWRTRTAHGLPLDGIRNCTRCRCDVTISHFAFRISNSTTVHLTGTRMNQMIRHSTHEVPVHLRNISSAVFLVGESGRGSRSEN